MTKIYQNVHGFNLKLPFNDSKRNYSYNNSEWIEIIKKPNKLPTVKLTTIVLYYRNDGKDITSVAPGVGDDVLDDENYRFYNDYNVSKGKQLGWIWGFPLFDVGRENVESDVSGNWPRWGSCIGSKPGFVGSDTSGNETMLVDLSANKNIIVLDCSGLQPKVGQGSIDISNNVTKGQFFMILRIKSSKESNVSGDITNNLDFGDGKNGNWNVYNNLLQRQSNRWATLVKYEYECDIIGPKKMLDFTFDYFMVDDSGIGIPIYQKDGTNENYLAIPNRDNKFERSRDNSCKIITGLQTGEANDIHRRMDIKDILTNLSVSGPNKLQIKDSNSGSTIVKLIGGWYNDLSSNNIDANCYYGDTFSGSDGFITDMSSISVAHKTEGWKNFINLSTDTSANDWSGNSYTSSYELKNILWCSLQSPRKTPVTKYQGDTKYQRYITNWIDLSGGGTSNEIIGGGYGLYPNTIDLPRKSINPYYSASKSLNIKTVSIDNFVIGSNNYLDASSTPLELIDLNYFRVYYKLLIPPDVGHSFKLSFTTGKSINSVTTFVRHTEMAGLCEPSGKDNLSAKRDEETITLKWDIDSVNSETNDISMQSICFTDIASGHSHLGASFNITEDSSLNKIITDISKNYDISFNVFQLNFSSRTGNTTSTDELPYTIKTLNTNVQTTDPQIVDIKYIPINYTPYRYINYNIINGQSIEGNNIDSFVKYFEKNSVFKDSVQIDEKLAFNVSKLYIKKQATGVNARIIKPKDNKNLSEKIIDIIDISGVYDNSYVYFKSDIKVIDDTVIVITKQDNNITIKNTVDICTNKVDYPNFANENKRTKYFEPLSLQLGNNFIPDYWRLPQKLNTIKQRNSDNTEYKYLDTWENQIKISMIIDVLSLSLSPEGTLDDENITHLLMNSINGSTQYAALTDEETTINSSDNNLIFNVEGALSIEPESYLNRKPIVVELSTSASGPFGLFAKNYIGEKSGYQYEKGVTPPDNKGINRPFPEQEDISANTNKYVVDTILLSKMQRGNGFEGSDLSIDQDGYNGEFNIELQAWDNTLNNATFQGTTFSPASLKVLLVELPEIYQINPNVVDMVSEQNSSVIIKWGAVGREESVPAFYFSNKINWEKSKSDVYWTISKLNISTGKSEVVLNNEQLNLNGKNEYEFVDSSAIIYEKFKYSVTGKFKWTFKVQNISQYLELDINGFITDTCFVCKNNRFPFGRFNTTSTNLKLFAPLRLNTPEGQVDQFNNKTAGGGCSDPSRPSLNLYSQGSRISSSNNIYANTTNQLSKKQTYVLLSKSRFRPDR